MEATRAAVETICREEYGRILAALIRVFDDWDTAEDVLQDALAKALTSWPESGIPANPGAWITTVARRKAIDRLRRDRNLADKIAVLGDEGETTAIQVEAIDDILDPDADDRLRLVFACCHPSLSLEARVALTLRTLGGLTTTEIARAFLLPEPTLAQRIVRAKKKIRTAGIPYRIPPDDVLPQRVPAVLAVLYLIYNEGYSSSSGADLIRRDLCREAIRLARVLVELLPNQPEAAGLLALMLLQDSRSAARVGPAGELVLLADQDRSTWNAQLIEEGSRLLQGALRSRRPGPYQIQAAIAAVHAEAPDAAATDWRQIALLYNELLEQTRSPIVELNRAVAVAMLEGPERGLELARAAGRDGVLDEYLFYHATLADLFRRAGQSGLAQIAYERALELAGNASERAFLQGRIDELLNQERRR